MTTRAQRRADLGTRVLLTSYGHRGHDGESLRRLTRTKSSYYAQCYPDGATSTAVVSTTSGSTSTVASTTSSSAATTVTTSQSTTALSTTSLVTTTTAASDTGSGVPTTLVSGFYWIRGVETPYYHSYLQTLPTATPGDALMDSYETAGQFNIVDGQLVYDAGSSGTADVLYMNVEDPADKTQRALATWFNATENAYGTFAFSGDTVTWTDPDVDRPNTAAFYVCPDNTTAENLLFINTGAYLYDTPSGCYDVDVSSLRAVRDFFFC